MKTYSMSFVLLMTMLFAAAPSRAASDESQFLPTVVNDRCPDQFCPRPIPEPRHCPEGMSRVFDEYQGRYICVPHDDFEIRPMREDQMKKLSGVLDGDDMAAKGEALDGYFDATQGRKSESSAVSAGSWGTVSFGFSVPKQLLKTKSGVSQLAAKNEPRIVLAAEPEHRDMMEEAGQNVKDAIIGKAIDKVIEKVDNANKAIDSIGNGLRSDGDSALQKGTQAQKDAERKHGK